MNEQDDILLSLSRHTLPQILVMQAERFGINMTAIREKAYGIWHAFSWDDYLRYVRHVALGLKQLKIRRGENIAIVTNNHPEWLFSEIGAHAVGAVTLNLFTSSVASELASSLERINAAYVIVQDQEQVDKMIECRDRLKYVKRVIYIDPTGMRSYKDDPWLLSFSELLAMGEQLDGEKPEMFAAEIKKGKPEDVAIMIQTSGTTGISKLAMLSHRNLAEMGVQWIRSQDLKPGENWLSMSPPAWIVDQMWGAGVALLGGMTMNFPETLETIDQDFREIGPSVIITSSRFWEDLASKIRVKISDAGAVKRKLFYMAENIGRRIVDLAAEKKPVPFWLKAAKLLAAVLVYHPLLDRIGCAGFKGAYTGGHPISPDVIRFFRAIGLNLKQCYGLTEAGGIFQVQDDDEVKPETVGKPLPATQVKIADDQEVLVFSRANFSGYYQDYNATEAAFHDGWLRTGDAGYFDPDGHLVIIGRKEEIIKNKSGQAFSPDFIETRLKFSPYIKEAVVFGEGRPFITLMVNIDMGNVGNWAEDRMIPYTTYMDLSQQPMVEKLISEEIEQVNKQLPDIMKIKKFLLLYKLLDADDDELTRTGKVRRRFIYGLYIKLIEAMYGEMNKVDVKGKVRYRDGQTGVIETSVNIINMN